MDRKQGLNKSKLLQKGGKEGKLKYQYQKFFGWVLLIFGVIILISALPQKIPNVWDFGFIKLNIGTQWDVIRFVMGGISLYIGQRGIKGRW